MMQKMEKYRPVASAVASALDEALSNQPWYRRYAGTITNAATAVVALGTWLTATLRDLPTEVSVTLGVVVFIASVVAQRATGNGLTPRTNVKVIDAVTEPVEAAAMDAVQKVRTAAESASADVVGAAKAYGFDVHDPRFIGLPVEQAARAFLTNRSGPQ